MFKRYFVLFLVVGILSLGFIMGSCGKRDETMPTTTTTTTPTTTSTTTTTIPIGGVEYFPHEDGYSWTYKLPPTSTTTMEIQTLDGTITIPGTSIEVLRVRKLLYSDTGTTTEGECYWSVDNDGAYHHSCGTPTTEALSMLRFPIVVGGTWTETRGISIVTGEVVSYEIVTVEAGTFNAYKVSLSQTMGSSSYYFLYWYGENAGLVKSYSPADDLTTELISKSF